MHIIEHLDIIGIGDLEYEFGPIVDSDDEEESDIDISMSEDGDCSEDHDDELPALIDGAISMDVD